MLKFLISGRSLGESPDFIRAIIWIWTSQLVVPPLLVRVSHISSPLVSTFLQAGLSSHLFHKDFSGCSVQIRSLGGFGEAWQLSGEEFIPEDSLHSCSKSSPYRKVLSDCGFSFFPGPSTFLSCIVHCLWDFPLWTTKMSIVVGLERLMKALIKYRHDHPGLYLCRQM